MFNITQYLQYKNTLDGKPRVLREGVDYEAICQKYLVKDYNFFDPSGGGFDFFGCIKLEDCRPLLTVEIDGIEWTEGDISLDSIDCHKCDSVTEYEKSIYGYWCDKIQYTESMIEGESQSQRPRLSIPTFQNGEFKIVDCNIRKMNGDFIEAKDFLKTEWLDERLGSFFDNPTKYSKLLWNCSEEEGWEKVLKLLI